MIYKHRRNVRSKDVKLYNIFFKCCRCCFYSHGRAGRACCWSAWAWGRRRTASSSDSLVLESLGGGRFCREAEVLPFLLPPTSFYSTVGRRHMSQSIWKRRVTEEFSTPSFFHDRLESDGWPVPPTEMGRGVGGSTVGSQQGIEKQEEITSFDVQCWGCGGGGW